MESWYTGLHGGLWKDMPMSSYLKLLNATLFGKQVFLAMINLRILEKKVYPGLSGLALKVITYNLIKYRLDQDTQRETGT